MYYHKDPTPRATIEEITTKLKDYDTVSFAIFDTLLYRKVDTVNDLFLIMAAEMDFEGFLSARRESEAAARQRKLKRKNNKEVVLAEIYDVLQEYYGIDKKWMERELELELELATSNPFIKEVYIWAKKAKKTIMFTGDTYLPKQTVETMLVNNGYSEYDRLYLSNELGLRKADGSMQALIVKDCGNTHVIHIGDSETADYIKFKEAELDAIYNPDQKRFKRYSDNDGFAGSTYNAVINNNMGCGMWNDNLHYDHGFRVGGVLVAGYSMYLNDLAGKLKTDKILFPGCDGDVLLNIYNKYFKQIDNSQIELSTNAILAVTAQRYFSELIANTVLKRVEECRERNTIAEIFVETGFDYLVEYLEDNDIEMFLFPARLKKGKLEEFLWEHKDLVVRHNEPGVKAAKQYFSEIIGDSKSLLIAGVGWDGGYISAFKHFVQTHFPEKEIEVKGALLCTSKTFSLKVPMHKQDVFSYIFSPHANMDMTRFMLPANKTEQELDLFKKPLEYLFAMKQASLAGYALDGEGNVQFTRTALEPKNQQEIELIEQGMTHFVEEYCEYAKSAYINSIIELKTINPYVAFGPLRGAIKQVDYCYQVYKNFSYGTECLLAVPEDVDAPLFESIFEDKYRVGEVEYALQEQVGATSGAKILFVSAGMGYDGAPNSLLAACKTVKAAGYRPIVWTMHDGLFKREFLKAGIPVECVPEGELHDDKVQEIVSSVDMALCNTIMTGAYVEELQKYVPMIWYIHEAGNIYDFISAKPERLKTLKGNTNICCVSEHAAGVIEKLSETSVKVVHNCAEDLSEYAKPYSFLEGNKVKFVQLGTLEHIKGYDIFVGAFLAMPKEYQDRAELYFAGKFVNTSASFASKMFYEIRNNDNVHYLGQIRNEKKKIEILSEMDVVVVASRDESSSLVALEGAMLSKPLIVTENVGAKYMVDASNGYIVETGSIEALKDAYMRIIDNSAQLMDMGKASRKKYDKLANMNIYRKNILALIKEKLGHKPRKNLSIKNLFGLKSNSDNATLASPSNPTSPSATPASSSPKIIVSLTTDHANIQSTHTTIDSLLDQSQQPDHIQLWLAREQFLGGIDDLPTELTSREGNIFSIKWCNENLGDHNKYLHAMQEHPNDIVITVEDGLLYDFDFINVLHASYVKHPRAISAMRTSLMMFKPNGELRGYDNWLYGYTIYDKPSHQLIPIGSWGVLYPPHSISQGAFNEQAIKECRPDEADIWLKLMASVLGTPVVTPSERMAPTKYEGAAKSTTPPLANAIIAKQNDSAISRTIKHIEATVGESKKLLQLIRSGIA